MCVRVRVLACAGEKCVEGLKRAALHWHCNPFSGKKGFAFVIHIIISSKQPKKLK